MDETKRVFALIQCAQTLGRFGPAEAEIYVPLLIEALDDAAESVRHNSAWLLGQIGPVAASSIPALATVLRQDASGFVRRTSAEALSRMGIGALPALVTATKDKDWIIRLTAKRAIEAINGTR